MADKVRVDLIKFDKTVHKLLDIARDLKTAHSLHGEKIDRVVLKLASLKQELQSELEWNDKNGGG